MKVKSDTTGKRGPLVSGDSGEVGRWRGKQATPAIVAEVLERLSRCAPAVVACAPGRLDVMGGLAEYTGSLVLNMTIAQQACVAVQRRPGNELTIIGTPSLRLDRDRPTVMAMSKLWGMDGAPTVAAGKHAITEEEPKNATRCVVGTLIELLHAGLLSRFDGGLSVVVGSTLSGLSDAGENAAIAAATMAATCTVHDVTLEPMQAAALCQRVENDWIGVPVGIGDAVCSLLGDTNALNQMQCESGALGTSIPFPEGVVLLGINCGVMHSEGRLKYERVRTAAFMGRALIDRIIRHDGNRGLKWDGFLSQVSVTDYVERFRDRLPTKLKGSEYLERFGETGDPLTRIDPNFVYRVRSRTEHHIYENARAWRFADCMQRALHGGDERALTEAGELMYASHWSYGQRCGLGSIETDFLVQTIRSHGTEADIYGAKITGRGCGGSVAVLMRASEKARAAVDATIQAYRAKTGRKATLLDGSSPGTLKGGVHRVGECS